MNVAVFQEDFVPILRPCDGRARNIKEAIFWHGGEAEAARNAFAKLSKEDRERLIAFVNSL